MSREIKFRALRDDASDCTFKFGSLIVMPDGTPRIVAEFDDDTGSITYFTCIKGTEGEYTGLKDKNGKDIYEGDCFAGDDCDIYVVAWNECEAKFEVHIHGYGEDGVFELYSTDDIEPFELQDMEIIGNIHENPDLIK